MHELSDEWVERETALLKVKRRVLWILRRLTPAQRRRVITGVAVLYGQEEAVGLRHVR